MSRTPEISIIVPVYQAAATIQLCINSILNQTFTDWELLLIDDGSDDDSLFQCQQMADDDERIRVFAQKHQGVSAARNFGLSNMKGQYVCFIDADDIVESDYLESLYQYKDFDMVICGYYVDKTKTNGELIKREVFLPKDVELKNLNERTSLIPLFMQGMIHINCNKLLHSNIIKKRKLLYSPIPINEDYVFMTQYLFFCNSLKTVGAPLYHWVQREGKQSGVSAAPSNLLQIYNDAHDLTASFFGNKEIASEIMYYSYYLVILKYFKMIGNGRKTYKDLNELMDNRYVRESFSIHKAGTLGEFYMKNLLKMRWFRLFHFIHSRLI